MTKSEIFCNICGKKFDYWDERAGYHIKRVCGFGSVNDGTVFELDICNGCMDKIIEGCKINPLEVDAEGSEGLEAVFGEN